MKKVLYSFLLAPCIGYAGEFDGAYIQGAVGGVSSQTTTTYPTALNVLPGFDINPSKNSSSMVGQILVGYSYGLDRFNLAGSSFYNIGDQVAGTNSYSVTNGTYGNITGSITGNQGFKLENTWGINLEPGFYATDDTLAYLKLSYINTVANYNASSSGSVHDSYTHITYTTSSIKNKSLDGIGYGVGVKHKFSTSLYAYAEYQHVEYSTWKDKALYDTTYSINQNYGWVGLGYVF